MAAYSSDGAEFTGGVLRVFDGSAWTGARDNGYYWNGTAWTRFQPDSADDLGQPQSLAAVPGDLEAAFTWVDDTPKTVIPTHVQLRLPATTAVWVEVEYGTLEWDVAFLFPETAYQMQARYIRREDGSIVGTGPISEVFFSTLALDGPGAPAADPGGSGPDSTFNWGVPQGGPTCTWEYIVQTATTPASGFITWADTAVTGSFLGSLGSIDLDLVAAGLTCGGLARFKYREVCGGVPADYLFGDPFTMVCDWDVACGGLDNSAWVGVAPLTDAILAMPKICVADAETMIIEDHIGTQVYGKLDGFSFMIQAGGQDVLVGKSGMVGWKPIAAGPAGDLALLTDVDDASFTVKANLYDVPGGAGGGPTDSFPIGRFGKNVALSAVRASTSTWYARASWQKADGSGGTTLTGTTPLALDEFNVLAVTFDNSAGAVKLYANGVEEATTTGEAAAFSDAGIGQDVELYGNDTIRITQVAAWDRELTAIEVGLLSAPPYPYYISENHEAIANSAVTHDHTLPSGIQAGDLIMVLWKTNETASTKTVAAPPAGWTQANLSRATFLWYKLAAGGETSVTASWTGGASGDPTVSSLVYRNVDQTNPFERDPECSANNSTTTIYSAPNSAPATSENTSDNKTIDHLDNWTSYMEGTTYCGIAYAGTTLTLNPSTSYQPNLLERQQTVNTNDVIHFSHEGLTENSGLYNDQLARWSHGTAFNGGFHAILRAPRTDEWLAKTHVAYSRTIRTTNSSDSPLMTVADAVHFDGLLALVAVHSSDGAIPASPAFDTSAGVNTWMTARNSHIYTGTWAAAGRQARNASASTQYATLYLIANANTSDPVSLALQRSYNSTNGHPSLNTHRFWTRTDQLILGTFVNSGYDIDLATLGSSTAMAVENQDRQVNTTSGNYTAQRIHGRGIVDGWGMTPTVALGVSWSINSNSWVSVNHSTESSPTLATPTIVGTPTTAERSTAGSGSITITKPSGCQVGEILLMMTHLQSGAEFSGSANVPDGFEPISHGFAGGNGVGEIEIWTKEVDGTEPASWTVTVSGQGIVTMQRMTGILPWSGKQHSNDTSTLTNPHPHGTPTVFNPGVVLRVSAYQDGTARVIATSVGTPIQADYDSPPLSTSTTHIEITGEVIAGTTVGAANYTVTPFPGAPGAARCRLYHLAAGPA